MSTLTGESLVIGWTQSKISLGSLVLCWAQGEHLVGVLSAALQGFQTDARML